MQAFNEVLVAQPVFDLLFSHVETMGKRSVVKILNSRQRLGGCARPDPQLYFLLAYDGKLYRSRTSVLAYGKALPHAQ